MRRAHSLPRIRTGESYKAVVKRTFAQGSSLADPARLVDSSLDGNARRAIDVHEGEEVDASAFKALIRQAAGIEAAKGGSASTRDQRPTPHFPSENGAHICPGESMRVRSIWSFFGPLGPLAGR